MHRSLSTLLILLARLVAGPADARSMGDGGIHGLFARVAANAPR